MKKLLRASLLIAMAGLLLGSSPFVRTGGDPQISGNVRFHNDVKFKTKGFDERPATKTMDDLDLYVRTTGADTNDCLSAAKACLTIQEVIDRIPKEIHHAVVVDIGAGSFAAFNVNGFNIGETGTLDINGTLELASGLTGLNTGTFEDSAGPDYHQSNTDNEGGWVVDELVGKLLVWPTGYYRPIISNTATVVHYVGGDNRGNGDYTIQEQTTIITGAGIIGYAGVEVTNVLTLMPSSLTIRNLKDTSATTMGFLMYASSGTLERCYSAGQYFGFVLGQSPRVARTVDCFVGPCAVAGFYFQESGGVYLEDAAAERCVAVGAGAGSGFKFQQSIQIRADYIHSTGCDEGLTVESVGMVNIHYAEFDDNDNWGVLVDRTVSGNASSHSNVWLRSVDIDNNGTDGIRVTNEANVHIEGVTGTGNAIYGVYLRRGATLKRTVHTCSITGGTADLSMDGGASLTWVTHLNGGGDTIINIDNGCRAEYE